jgi:type I restriction enzyme S subunit
MSYSFLPIPGKNEQERIAKFLDQKTAEIDAAIAKKKRLIELLQEQKSILINQAVTLSLNPNVALRDSGVEWIGKIPNHWDTLPLKHVSTVQGGVTLGKNYAQSLSIKSYPYLRVANVQDGFLDLSKITEINLPAREANNYLLKHGDILVTEGGDIDKRGRGTCWYGEIKVCLHQNHIFAVRIDRKVLPEYVSLITGVTYARRYFTTTANKTTNLASTNKTKLGNLPLTVPPKEEQQLILEYCTEIRTRFEILTDNIIKEIAALKEMKDTLIVESVTGKLKV